MSIKRSSACMLAAAMEHPPSLGPCDTATYGQPHKRLCSGPSAFTPAHTVHIIAHSAAHLGPHHQQQLMQVPGSFPLQPLQPLSQLSPGVQAYLVRQLSGQPGPVHTLLPPGFSDAVWQCFGELNLEMEQHFASLPARAIRGYHSFTRMPRAMLLERYALSLQQQGHGHALQLWVEGQRQGAAAGDGSALPLQAQLLLLLLDKVLSQYPEAALVHYTLEAQPWLLPWCQRWGLARAPASAGCPPLVSVAAVHVYAPHPPLAPLGQQQGQGEGASGAGLPAQVLYVPCFQN